VKSARHPRPEPPAGGPRLGLLAALLALSGAGALMCEVVWMRRLALLTGSGGIAITGTITLYMGGLGLGSLWRGRRPPLDPARAYAACELGAAGWAIGLPTLLAALSPMLTGGRVTQAAAAAALLVPPAMMHGATLPALGPLLPDGRATARLYAANTFGAVAGVLAATFVLLPSLGVRGTELVAAGLSATAGAAVWARWRQAGSTRPRSSPPRAARVIEAPLDRGAAIAAAAAGLAAMALEVCWSRLGALLLGGSVYAFAVVLSTFLLCVAGGAALGRRWGRRARTPALAAIGLLAAVGTWTWDGLPHAVGLAWQMGGAGALLPAGAALLMLAMAGAPLASGVVFAAALDQPGRPPGRVAGGVLAANTVGSVVGAAGAGLWALPTLGLRGTTLAAAGVVVAVAAGSWLMERRPRPAAAALAMGAALALASPRWDPALYAVGVGLRVHEFADLSPRAIDRFAHGGWELLSYRDGRSASVAVGRSTETGNLWLSLNGKVDASTGADMPTQVLSGELPVRLVRARGDGPLPVGVVGLASGVTAHAALEAGASGVTVLELEPAVVDAAALFSDHNGDLLTDPRATIRIDDARAWMRRPGPPLAAIISEPSNPWITGVSNLFTREYWALGHARLRPGGVFVQWVQLYALPPEAFRSLVATFCSVFDDVWLFETIPGADALLMGTTRGYRLPPGDIAALPLSPTLDPAGVARLSAGARLNTDDQPWVEFAAPRWLHRQTAADNRALLEAAAAP